jgi:hypothetical protein
VTIINRRVSTTSRGVPTGHPRQRVINDVVGLQGNAQPEEPLALGEQPAIVELFRAEPCAELAQRLPLAFIPIGDPLPGFDDPGTERVRNVALPC